jgi:3-oxoadipate enol-lactonase
MTEGKAVKNGFGDINGAKLYYEVAGNGFPLVMLHGHLLDNRLITDFLDQIKPNN